MSLPLLFLVVGAVLVGVLRALVRSDQRDAFLSELSRIEREIKKVDRQIDRLESEALHALRHARAEQRFEEIR